MDLEQMQERARRFTQKGMLEKALGEYDKILKLEPDNVSILQKKADVLNLLGFGERAMATLRQIARCYSQRGFHEKAIAICQQVMTRGAQTLEMYLEIAADCESAGLGNESAFYLNHVVESLVNQGELYKAVALLKKIIAKQPNRVLNRFRLVRLYLDLEMHLKAIDELIDTAKHTRTREQSEQFVALADELLYHACKQGLMLKELGEGAATHRSSSRKDRTGLSRPGPSLPQAQMRRMLDALVELRVGLMDASSAKYPAENKSA